MSPIVKNANIILIFLGGIIATGFFKDEVISASIPYLAMVGAFLGISVNRTKHLDDLNMTRKKEVSLEFVEDASEYGSVLVSLIEENSNMKIFFSDLNVANKKFISSMNKFHVVCSDETSSKIESLHFKLNELMLKMSTQATALEKEPDKIKLITWFIQHGVLSKLNDVRYEILELVNNEIGDGSGTAKFKKAIEKCNADYTNMFSELLSIADK